MLTKNVSVDRHKSIVEGIAQCRSKVHGALKDTQVLADGRDSGLRSLEKKDRETLGG
jgi:hypothetical protein